MNLYHGSIVCVPDPQLLPSARCLDFGSGFYTTTDVEQAERWAQIKQRRLLAPHAMVSIYNADAVFTSNELLVQSFKTPNEEWLDFVLANRMGNAMSPMKYDVVRGPVANDTLYETLALFERGILTRAETIVRLKAHVLADQVVFVTKRALTALCYIQCVEVSA